MQSAKDSDDDGESLPALRFEASRLKTELEEARAEAKAAEDRAGEAEEELEDLETRSRDPAPCCTAVMWAALLCCGFFLPRLFAVTFLFNT